jgi:hypothetical protein
MPCALRSVMPTSTSDVAETYTWVVTEPAALACIGHGAPHELRDAPNAPGPSTAEVRACARANDIRVADRGRLRPDIWEAWHAAKPRPLISISQQL